MQTFKFDINGTERTMCASDDVANPWDEIAKWPKELADLVTEIRNETGAVVARGGSHG